jgi:glycosyltransferase
MRNLPLLKVILIKFSIITVTKNSAETIEDTLASVSSQKYTNLEHIIKDGNSVDSTIDIIKKFSSNKVNLISKKDLGIYDAMNQAFDYAIGDVVSFLNSDDYFIDDSVLEDIALIFQNESIDYVYGNIRMVDKFGQKIRAWNMNSHQATITNKKQIAHPALFVRRRCLARLTPCFDASYKISADLKQQLILLYKLNLIGEYIPRVIAIVQTGGESTKNLSSFLLGWRESIKAYNDVFENGGFFFTIKKVLIKIPYFFWKD